MASYHYVGQPFPNPHSVQQHSHHGGRSRRAPRLATQNTHRQFRGVRSMKELTEAPMVNAFRTRFDSARSFDLEDDMEFCPGLLTEDDIQSLSSSSSDRSSLASSSPDASPLQHQAQPTHQPAPNNFSLSAASNPYHPSTGYMQSSAISNSPHTKHLQMHQPSALRSRNAIPIVNPSTGMRVSSPPKSLSPAMMQQQQQMGYQQRRW